MRISFIVLSMTPLLAACDLGNYVDTSFRHGASAASIDNGLSDSLTDSLTSPLGDVYMAAGVGDSGARAYAGMTDTSVGVQLPANTSVNYTGAFEVVGMYGLTVVEPTAFSSGSVSGFTFRDGGSISLDIDTSTGDVTGGGSGMYAGVGGSFNRTLTVDGNLSGTGIDGTVTYAGIEGSLEGYAGTSGAIGAFHGTNDDDIIYGGGFVAD